MSAPTTEQPATTMPPASEALLRRLNAWAERMIATNPALAEAIRRRQVEAAAPREEGRR